MNKNLITKAGTVLLLAVWLCLAICAWCRPSDDVSTAERRPLAQFPSVTAENLLSGAFMEDFEDYSLDQFPMRDSFRQVKALLHYGVLNQSDNNGIYIADGTAAKLEYPLSSTSVSNAVRKFNQIYDSFLADTGSNICFAIVPDKNYFLAEQNGYPAMDYEAMYTAVETGLPWANHVDLTGCLEIGDYYRTDTHWRQERLLPVAQELCRALNVTAPEISDFTQTAIAQPFYGVYYGQAALPMDADTMYLLENAAINRCTVYNYETRQTTRVYDKSKLAGNDLYDVYLSGAAGLLTIQNPAAATDRELIVFRDSFGSSLIPLLLRDYRTVTVVDIRYLSSALLPQYVSFHGQDVLFLYSTLVLNNGTALK